MKTVIIGGGKGCQAILELTKGTFLQELAPEVMAVMDLDPSAPGMVYAGKIGVPTFTDMKQALTVRGVELIIELTGKDAILEDIQRILPPRVKLIDHTIAHVFWDLLKAQETQKKQIEEQVRLRQEIENAEERFHRFIDSAKDHITIKDLEGRYLVVNETTAITYHRKKEEFIGRKAEEILPRGIAMIVNHHDQEVIRRNILQTYEEIFQIDGRNRHFNTMRFPLTDLKGDPIGVCTIARDVTKRRELEDQLVQSAKLVAVGKLAAGVAHEINNPLTGILAYAEDMLDEVSEESPLHADLQVVIRETLRCREIVRNLMDFARQDAPRFEKVYANDVVKQSLSLVERLPRFKNVKIKKHLGEDLPAMQVDPRQIQQVILNLMLNAVEAMKEKGTITLTTDYNRRQHQCVISVEDTGPGIPENLIDKVFEPFFSSKGTSGLGLAVSWGIVERHRGVIEVDTSEGGGAIFLILLPALSEWV